MARQPVRWRNLVLLFCLVGEVVVLFGAGISILTQRRKQKEATFLPVEATISRVEVYQGGGGRSSRTWYSPRVWFRYRVHGTEYEASEPGRGIADTREEAEQAAKASYPAGKTVQAFYDPANPGDAVLERDSPLRDFWGFFFCCLGGPFLVLLPGSILAVRHLLRSAWAGGMQAVS